MTRLRIEVALVLIGLAGCGDSAEPIFPRPTTTPTATATPRATPTPGTGPRIGFFGVLRADNTLVQSTTFDAAGRPVYARSTGSGFVLVIDAVPGPSGANVGPSTFNSDSSDPSVRPDLQIEVTRDLGNGSTIVCDNASSAFGGVPGIDPPSFDLTQPVADALNDIGCRFDDGAGNPRGREPDSACVLFPDGEFHFVDASATIEFCGTIPRPLNFPAGDTIITARVRDVLGNTGPEQQIVIRVGQ